MKKFVLVCLATLISSPAFASKARVNALQGILGLVDTQTVFDQPAYINKLDKYATFEMGSSSVSGTPRAEGGFMTSHNDAHVGAYLGHQSDFVNLYRGASFQKQDNPVEFFYGKDNFGASLSISNSADNTTNVKQQAVTARGGLLLDAQSEVALSADLYHKAEKTTAGVKDTLKSQIPTLEASYLTRRGVNVYQASLLYGTAEQNVTNVKGDIDLMGLSLAWNHWLVANNLYVGANFNYVNYKVAGKDRTAQTLPLVIGFEKDAWSWLTLRGSVAQNFLFGTNRDEITPVARKNNLNDTTVAAGLGIKQGSFSLDGLFSASSTGKLNGTDFLSQGSLTYWF